MKLTDDYQSKIKAWSKAPVCVRLPRMAGNPPFRAKKFSSHAEMNAWKQSYIEQIARQGGVKWTN